MAHEENIFINVTVHDKEIIVSCGARFKLECYQLCTLDHGGSFDD